MRADREELHASAEEAWKRVVRQVEGEMRLDAEALSALPRPIGPRVVRSVLYRATERDEAMPSTKEAVDAVLDLAAGRPGRRRELPGGLKARREREYVSVSRTSPESRV